ncbi:MAG: efflux RND transporter periplasmic adaptor subunit [Candidatus Marinimicrobia bacterium]|nr:efflux RND transporter periplasmic adaptor subunit [Candidatus Neomarinimicrobiota bacterium]
MNKKIGLLVAGVIVIFGFLISNLLSKQKEPVTKKPSQPALSNYKFQTVQNQTENFDVVLSGNLLSYDELVLYTEVTGVAEIQKNEFREGANFKKGDVLLKIDDDEFKNSVYAQKSGFMNNLTVLIPDLKLDFPASAQKWEDYLNAFDITREMKPLPAVTDEKERYYIASKNIFNQYYSIKGQEVRLTKYTIRAPFDGVLTSASIKPGTLVRAGQQIGVFKNTRQFEMTAYASIDEVQLLKVGMIARLVNSDFDEEFTGRVSRINQSVDKTSQQVKVYIMVEDDKLYDGLFFNATINVDTRNTLVKIPSEAVFNKGSVWINDNGKFKSQRLRIVNRIDDFVFVSGLNNGQQILLNPDQDVAEGKSIPVNNTKSRG